ncbi:glutaredoxin 3 [Vairimorpha apis BRL 01]|uniref:Glutaredoxin 3 n=1 Tax=Vairimorpha apis BRL 01 TaxID=1037528 RepID=T0MIL6_9MICR|nr:glutaredoxin 3 [Vairimorpha apis BRL 01]
MLIILPLIFTLDLKITKAKYKSNISSNDEHDNNINKNNTTKHDNNLTYSNHNTSTTNTSNNNINNNNTSTTNTYNNTYNNNKYINQLNSAPIVVIYKKYCPYSIQTLTTLTSLNYNFNKYEKSENPDLAEYVKTNIYSKYPAIFVDGKFFGGNDVLQDALKNKKFVSSGYKIGDKMSSKDNISSSEDNISSRR